MITDGKKWHYIALKGERTEDGFNRLIKNLSRLFRGIKIKSLWRFLLFELFTFI